MFSGNESRLYFESRAVAYENLVRSGEVGRVNQFRNMYTPFYNTTKFTLWIVESQINVLGSWPSNFFK
jgi:hypothetical protein